MCAIILALRRWTKAQTFKVIHSYVSKFKTSLGYMKLCLRVRVGAGGTHGKWVTPFLASLFIEAYFVHSQLTNWTASKLWGLKPSETVLRRPQGIKAILKNLLILGQRNGSAGKEVWHASLTTWIQFLDLMWKWKEKDPNSQNYPLHSVCMPWHMATPHMMYIHKHLQIINKK